MQTDGHRQFLLQRTTITIDDADRWASSIRSPKDGEGIDAVAKGDNKKPITNNVIGRYYKI